MGKPNYGTKMDNTAADIAGVMSKGAIAGKGMGTKKKKKKKKSPFSKDQSGKTVITGLKK